MVSYLNLSRIQTTAFWIWLEFELLGFIWESKLICKILENFLKFLFDIYFIQEFYQGQLMLQIFKLLHKGAFELNFIQINLN